MSTVLERLEACMQAFFAPPHNLSNLQSIDSSMDLHKSPREVRACKPSLRPLTEQGASFPVQRGKDPWDWEQYKSELLPNYPNRVTAAHSHEQIVVV